MSSFAPIPPELQHLIEKRAREVDRRNKKRRTEEERRTLDLGPLGAIESAESIDDVPLEERRREKRRRKAARREARRRDDD